MGFEATITERKVVNGVGKVVMGSIFEVRYQILDLYKASGTMFKAQMRVLTHGICLERFAWAQVEIAHYFVDADLTSNVTTLA